MKKWILAIIAACALCCVPLLIPAVAGLSVFGLQLFGGPLSVDRALCALAPAVLAAVLVFAVLRFTRRPAKAGCGKATCDATGKCGCK